MSDMPPGLPEHPIGTFAFMGLYAIIVVAVWIAMYVGVYLGRGAVTP
jgi:hypothetical protein